MRETLKRRAIAALRWSERYTGTDMVYLASGGAWLSLGYLLQIGTGLVLVLVLANLLPKASYGVYQFVLSGSAIIAALTLTGMPTAMARAAARGERGVLPYAFRVQLSWSSAMALIGGALSLYYFLHGNLTLGFSFLFAGAFSPFLTGYNLADTFLTGKKRFRESVTLGLWRKFLPLGAITAAVLISHEPAVIIFVYFASQTISSWLVYSVVTRHYPEASEPNPEMVSYSKHLSVLRSLITIAQNLDKVIIWYFLGAVPVAVYSIALMPVGHIQSIFSQIKPLSLPKLTNRSLPELRRTLPRKVGIFFLVTLITAAAYVFAAPFLFRLVLPSYLDAVPYTQVLALLLLSAPQTLFGQVFVAHGLKREQYVVYISVAVLRLALLMGLIPLFGLWGAIWATIGASVLYSTTLQGYLFSRLRG